MSIAVQLHDHIVAADSVSPTKAKGWFWTIHREGLLVYSGQEGTGQGGLWRWAM